MLLSHSLTRTSDSLTVHLVGEFTFSENSEFRLIVEDVVNSGLKDIKVDLSGLTRLDSAALSMLMLLRERMSKLNGQVSLLKPPAQIARILEVVDFGRLFTITY